MAQNGHSDEAAATAEESRQTVALMRDLLGYPEEWGDEFDTVALAWGSWH